MELLVLSQKVKALLNNESAHSGSLFSLKRGFSGFIPPPMLFHNLSYKLSLPEAIMWDISAC